jgi:hypothetical protein
MPDIRFTVPGGTAAGYLAVPSAPGPWPGVVVIHEAFGLNDDILAKANDFASHGYLALAPDLYDHRPWIRCVRAAFGQLRAGNGPAFGILDAAGAPIGVYPRGRGPPGPRGRTARARPASSASAWAADSRSCARRGTGSRRPR